MKKAILFTLAALCVSAVQALTVEWTGTSADLDVGKNYAAVCLFTPTSSQTSICEFYNGTKNALRIKADNTLVATTNQYNAATGTLSPTLTPDETHVLAINAIFKGDDTYDFVFYADGYNIGTITTTCTDDFAFWAATGVEVTGYEGTLVQDQLNYLVTNKTTTVPEPTALALLALGVAGLALKRKHA